MKDVQLDKVSAQNKSQELTKNCELIFVDFKSRIIVSRIDLNKKSDQDLDAV